MPPVLRFCRNLLADLRHDWRDPLATALCLTILLPVVVYYNLDKVTGVPTSFGAILGSLILCPLWVLLLAGKFVFYCIWVPVEYVSHIYLHSKVSQVLQ